MANLRVGFQLLIGFLTLINTSFATTPPNNVATSLEENGGYRCGRKVYYREFLIKSALAAFQRFQDINTDSEVADTNFPKAYTGPIVFGQGELFLWPLHDRGFSSTYADTDFLILGDSLTKIVGVVRGLEQRHVKCIKEDDLSDMYGTQYVEGYRCPLEFHSFGTIRQQTINAMSKIRGRVRLFEATLKPLEDLQLYHGIDKAWGWSITGAYHHRAITSIVVDEKFSIIGVVHLRNGIYTKCLVTSKKVITPKFVGKAILQQAESTDQESVDIFLCGTSEFISSEQVLKAASAAHRNLVWRRNFPSNHNYPLRYNSDQANVELYLWPLKLDKNGKYLEPHRYNKNEKYKVIIDYFSDVHGLVMKDLENQIHICQRMMYPRSDILESSIRSKGDHRDKRIKIT